MAARSLTSRPGRASVLLDFGQAAGVARSNRLDQFSGAHPGEFEGYRVDVDTDQDTAATYG
jgi:thioredoxin 1